MRHAPDIDGQAVAEEPTDYVRLLNNVARARDEAARLQLGLTSYLLDVVCLDLSALTSVTTAPKLRASRNTGQAGDPGK